MITYVVLANFTDQGIRTVICNNVNIKSSADA